MDFLKQCSPVISALTVPSDSIRIRTADLEAPPLTARRPAEDSVPLTARGERPTPTPPVGRRPREDLIDARSPPSKANQVRRPRDSLLVGGSGF
jgi:hypothetical protein